MAEHPQVEEVVPRESLLDKIKEKKDDKDSSSSSSDSDDDVKKEKKSPSSPKAEESMKSKVFRLFGREKPVHKVLGGGKRMFLFLSEMISFSLLEF